MWKRNSFAASLLVSVLAASALPWIVSSQQRKEATNNRRSIPLSSMVGMTLVPGAAAREAGTPEAQDLPTINEHSRCSSVDKNIVSLHLYRIQ